jgi:5-methylcytosine-specific restriction endonuclease McrA
VVSKKKLLKWQDGRCYHCNCKIRLDVEAPHPKSLTLDHLVPLALGGEHSYANTVASCWDCNCSIKGDRAINEQLKCV